MIYNLSPSKIGGTCKSLGIEHQKIFVKIPNMNVHIYRSSQWIYSNSYRPDILRNLPPGITRRKDQNESFIA